MICHIHLQYFTSITLNTQHFANHVDCFCGHQNQGSWSECNHWGLWFYVPWQRGGNDGKGQTCGEHILLHGLVDICLLNE